jgi:hypothetical protein
MSVPSNLIPTTITQLPEYTGSGTGGYMPYVIDGRTYKVLFSNIASVGAVPASRIIAAGTGLTGGGSLAADRVIAIANGGVGFDQLAASGATAGTYGSGTTVPVLTVDVKGRVTAATTTPVVISGYVPEGRSVIAGTGLTGGGTLTSNVTLAVNFASSDPQALGTATAGVSTAAARGDHVHPAVNLSDTSQTQGALPLGRGGTGDALSPVAGAVVYSTGTRFALSALGLPGQVLVSNGTSAPSWLTVSGVGTVTSVNVSGGTTGLTFTGGPITSAGTITAGGTLGVANGGTGTGTAFTSGSLVFAGSGGVYSQNNANLFWDNINSRLGIGTGSPLARLHLFDTLAPEARLQIGTNTSQGAYTFYSGGVNEAGAGFTPVSSILNVYSGRSAAWGGKITFTTDTTERMRITETGNVGIGTASPGTPLDVIGTTRSGNFRVNAGGTVTGAGMWGIDTILAFNTGSTERMRIDSAGNVGIGTSTPANRLQVSYTSTAPSLSSDVGSGASLVGTSTLRVNIGSDPSSPFGGWIQASNGSGSSFPLNLNPLGGNVGIGTTSPSGLLGIAGTTVIGNQATTGTDGTMRLVTAGGVTFIQSGQNRTSASAAPLAFTDMNGSSEWMRLTATGNLGIGTNTPSARLHVNGGNFLISTSGTYIEPAVIGGVIAFDSTNGDLNISARSNGGNTFMRFFTSSGGTGTERLRITTAGNVGIGSTSPTGRLTVSNTNAEGYEINPTGGVGGGATVVTYNRSTSVYITRTTYSSAHTWYVGTAGTTRAMDLTSTGILLVGKSASSGGTSGFEASATGFVATNSGGFAGYMNRTTSDGDILTFNRSATLVGSISVTTTATAYNTSSDYRLKNVDGPITNSGAYVDALKPVQGSWKSDGSRFIGLLAHEVQEVSETPIATGEKDGEQMQAMDYSAPELIANLIAEIQSLRARVAQLEGN